MKKIIAAAFVAGGLTVGWVAPVAAHTAPPCNDTNGDGSASGNEYAQHHIRPMAQDGNLGNEGHKPGTHRGFSACDPSGE